MRVLQVGGEWASGRSGGLNRYFNGLIEHLPKNGVDISAMAAGPRGKGDPPGDVFAAASDSLPGRLRAVRRAVRAQLADVDLIATHFAPYALPWIRLARRARVPVVVHFHGPWAAESIAEGGGRMAALAKRGTERFVYGNATRIITLSDAFKQVVVNEYKVDAAIVRVVPGGIDAASWKCGITRENAREQLGWPIDVPIAVCVRRLARRMGLDMLIESVNVTRSRHPAFRLYLAGSGDLREALQARIEREQLAANVTLLGFVPDEKLSLIYRAADVSVVPSRALEGFGLTTLESFAAGTPCLVTPVGGLPEAVEGLDRALILAGTSADDIAAGLHRAISDRASLPDAERCRQYVEQNFDWPIIARRVAGVYREAINDA